MWVADGHDVERKMMVLEVVWVLGCEKRFECSYSVDPTLARVNSSMFVLLGLRLKFSSTRRTKRSVNGQKISQHYLYFQGKNSRVLSNFKFHTIF